MFVFSFCMPFIMPTGSTGGDGKGLGEVSASFADTATAAKVSLGSVSKCQQVGSGTGRSSKVATFSARPVDTRRVLSKYQEAS